MNQLVYDILKVTIKIPFNTELDLVSGNQPSKCITVEVFIKQVKMYNTLAKEYKDNL